MSSASGDRAGLMVVRIWSDADCPEVRARLTGTLDLGSRQETVHTAAGVDQIVTIVRDWAEEFSAAGDPSRMPPGTSPGR